MLKAAGIYSRNRSKGIVSAVCSRDSRRALSVCSINWAEMFSGNGAACGLCRFLVLQEAVEPSALFDRQAF